jgi:hypothetical protein
VLLEVVETSYKFKINISKFVGPLVTWLFLWPWFNAQSAQKTDKNNFFIPGEFKNSIHKNG